MFKSLQVLRLTQSVRNTKGHPVKAGSRVVVVNVRGDEVKARYGTSKADYRYLTAPVDAFKVSVRGRPVGTGKNQNVTKVTAPAVAAPVAAPLGEAAEG